MTQDILKQWEKNQLDDHELTGAQESLKLAGEQNQNLAEESREIYKSYYEKILLYSAGAFSFSTALIGLVVGNKTEALAKVGFIFPNVYWLYFSLLGYLTACILILVAKRFDSDYVRHFGMHLYTNKYRTEQEAWLNKLQNYPGEILVTKDGSRESEINICKNNIKKLNDATNESLKWRNRSYSMTRFCQIVAECLALSSTILLLLFTIQLTQAVVWN